MAITYTKDWDASDDGSVFGGADIQNIQTDISGQAVDMISVQTITGVKTFSGNIVISGNPTISGDITFSGAVNLPATGVIIGAVNQGDIFFDDGTDLARLTPGTAGQILKSQGAGANPHYETGAAPSGAAGGDLTGTYPNPTINATIKKLLYYTHEDSEYFRPVQAPLALQGLIGNIPSSHSAAIAQIAGKVNAKCCNFAGTNYMTGTMPALPQNTKMTVMCWVYCPSQNAKPILEIEAYHILISIENGPIFRVTLDDGANKNVESSGFTANTWTFFTMIWDGTNMRMYKNGNTTAENTTAIASTVSPNAATWKFGGNGVNYFSGRCDGLRILGRDISTAQMASTYDLFA